MMRFFDVFADDGDDESGNGVDPGRAFEIAVAQLPAASGSRVIRLPTGASGFLSARRLGPDTTCGCWT